MSKTSKAYREAAEKVDRTKLYSPLEALGEEVERQDRPRRVGDRRADPGGDPQVQHQAALEQARRQDDRQALG